MISSFLSSVYKSKKIAGEFDEKNTELDRENRIKTVSEESAVPDFHYFMCGWDCTDFTDEDEYSEKLSGSVVDSERKNAPESVREFC